MKRSLFLAFAALFILIIFVILASQDYQASNNQDVAASKPELKINPEDPVKGNKDAKITIVEFGSYTCPGCKQAETNLKQLLALYPRDLRLVWKDFPHDAGASRLVAVAGRCAQLQGKFWQYHEEIFARGPEIVFEDVMVVADNLDLRLEEFERCVTQNQTLGLIEENIQEGVDQEITSVPYFIVNNEQIVVGDVSIGRWRQLLESYLND